jgi:ABC-2 type transport system ATP-binding protein
MAERMLDIQSLDVVYGDFQATFGIDLHIDTAETVSIIGANGAGKSTLLRTAAGLQPPDHGSVRVAGHDVWAAPIAAKAGLGYAAEDPVFHDELSAREYLAFVASVRALPPDEADARVAELSSSLDLSNRLDEPVAGFSHGMRKKLSFVAAILHRPRVLLCDEALEGFDAPSALAAKQELRALAAGGTAVLFSSHVTETVERLCDRVVMLRNGRIAATLERAEWGAPDDRVSPLERIFLDLTRTPDPVA